MVGLKELGDVPWLIGAVGILAAFVVTWLSDVLSTFQHFPDLPARARVLRFFGIGDLTWALALLLAVLLVALGTRVMAPPGPGMAARVKLVYTLVALASAAVMVSAAISAVVALSLAGQNLSDSGQIAYTTLGLPTGVNGAFVEALADLAVLPVAGAAGLWAWRSAHTHEDGPRP